jgi:hypothetical protein
VGASSVTEFGHSLWVFGFPFHAIMGDTEPIGTLADHLHRQEPGFKFSDSQDLVIEKLTAFSAYFLSIPSHVDHIVVTFALKVTTWVVFGCSNRLI